MWKSLSTIAICMSVMIGNVYAQNKATITLTCPSPQKINEVLDVFKEELVFAGLDTHHKVNNVTVTLFLNKETKTFSLLLSATNEKVMCILSSGEMGELIVKEK